MEIVEREPTVNGVFQLAFGNTGGNPRHLAHADGDPASWHGWKEPFSGRGKSRIHKLARGLIVHSYNSGRPFRKKMPAIPRTPAYVRVSMIEQTPENQGLGNQALEIKVAGFGIEPYRIITETVSGSMAITQRAGFSRLLDRMEKGDVLVVTKLDRLARDAIDVGTTVAKTGEDGHPRPLLRPVGVDLTSSAGKMTTNVITAVAQFERDLLIERTQAGLTRAKAQRKPLGRPTALSVDQQRIIRRKIEKGRDCLGYRSPFQYQSPTIMRARDQL